MFSNLKSLQIRCRFLVWILPLFFHWMPTLISAYSGAKMGVLTDQCDDVRSNLTVDWDFNYTAFTCAADNLWSTNKDVKELYYEIPNLDPTKDMVVHECMETPLQYEDPIPLRGNHRPNWGVYGEYLYLPPQRWLHNLEHGTVVMLYHPCADEEQVWRLRKLVTGCLFRHIITPNSNLTQERPLALLTWGVKLEMNSVNQDTVINFIRKHAKLAPEDLSKQGQYTKYLLRRSDVVSDIDDSNLCPQFPRDYSKQGTSKNYHTRRKRNRPRGPPERPVTYYDQVYLAQLQKFNGPKYATDVLPPSAILRQYEQPNYVMAGTYLGTDPYNPNTQRETPNLGRASGNNILNMGNGQQQHLIGGNFEQSNEVLQGVAAFLQQQQQQQQQQPGPQPTQQLPNTDLYQPADNLNSAGQTNLAASSNSQSLMQDRGSASTGTVNQQNQLLLQQQLQQQPSTSAIVRKLLLLSAQNNNAQPNSVDSVEHMASSDNIRNLILEALLRKLIRGTQ